MGFGFGDWGWVSGEVSRGLERFPKSVCFAEENGGAALALNRSPGPGRDVSSVRLSRSRPVGANLHYYRCALEF